MNAKVLAFGVVTVLLLSIVTESSGQWRRQHGFGNQHVYSPFGYPNRQPQPNNNWYQQLPPGININQAEWVCRNPKTNDMMIIASEEVPVPDSGNNGQPWQQPNYPPQTQPPEKPTYPPQPKPVTTQKPKNPFLPDYRPTEKTPKPEQITPNTNGDGVIDIRIGKK